MAAVAATGGIAAALVGLIDGIVMMTRRIVTECPNGHYFPPGTKDFACYAHPHAAVGLAISAISLSLGALLLVTALLSASMLSARGAGAARHPEAAA